jgi:hypothetical protein
MRSFLLVTAGVVLYTAALMAATGTAPWQALSDDEAALLVGGDYYTCSDYDTFRCDLNSGRKCIPGSCFMTARVGPQHSMRQGYYGTRSCGTNCLEIVLGGLDQCFTSGSN